MASPATGLFFDTRCLLHHCNYAHEESPERAQKSFQRLVTSGVWNECKHLQVIGCGLLDRLATSSGAKYLHGTDSVEMLQDESISTAQITQIANAYTLIEKYKSDPSGYTHPTELFNIHDNLSAHPTFISKFDETLASPFPVPPLFNPLYSIPSPLITDIMLTDVHHPSLVALVRATAEEDFTFDFDEVDSEAEEDSVVYPATVFISDDTFVNRFSAEAALVAVTGVVELTRAVCEHKIDTALAIIRPPGHHAGLPFGTSISFENSPDSILTTHLDTDNRENDESVNNIQGFCLFNNIAVAAEFALNYISSEGFTPIKKVLIVDFDVHHGNGTQHIFYEKNNVLFFSIHRFTENFFPGSGNYSEIGAGVGAGFSVNVPMAQGLGDLEYLAAFISIFLPIAVQFAPDIVFISAGMDCLRGDPLGGMDVTPECLYYIVKLFLSKLMWKRDGVNTPPRVVVALEGGYNPDAVADGVLMICRALLSIRDKKDNAYPSLPDDIRESVDVNKSWLDLEQRTAFQETLHAVVRQLLPFWQTSLSQESVESDVIFAKVNAIINE